MLLKVCRVDIDDHLIEVSCTVLQTSCRDLSIGHQVIEILIVGHVTGRLETDIEGNSFRHDIHVFIVGILTLVMPF